MAVGELHFFEQIKDKYVQYLKSIKSDLLKTGK